MVKSLELRRSWVPTSSLSKTSASDSFKMRGDGVSRDLKSFFAFDFFFSTPSLETLIIKSDVIRETQDSDTTWEKLNLLDRKIVPKARVFATALIAAALDLVL